MKDERTSCCLAIEVAFSTSHPHVSLVLIRRIMRYGCLQDIRSDNGSELVADALPKFFEAQGIKSNHITSRKPCQNGRNESLNGRFRRECLDAEPFHRLREARVVIEAWRRRYNYGRPHSALGYQVPGTVFVGAMKRKPEHSEWPKNGGRS